MPILKQSIRIMNIRGLHARAANKFARLVETFKSDVRVIHQGESANGVHRMDLLMLVAHQGCTIEIEVDGDDAEQAISALAALVENGFGELDEETAELS